MKCFFVSNNIFSNIIHMRFLCPVSKLVKNQERLCLLILSTSFFWYPLLTLHLLLLSFLVLLLFLSSSFYSPLPPPFDLSAPKKQWRQRLFFNMYFRWSIKTDLHFQNIGWCLLFTDQLQVSLPGKVHRWDCQKQCSKPLDILSLTCTPCL